MKIGLIRALMFYRYGTLWTEFFRSLGLKVIISPETDQAILASGIEHSASESCLPAKIFVGHALWLQNKCDYILIPRFDNMGKKEQFCIKLNGIFDICKNTFDARILDYNIDEAHGQTELRGFLGMGKTLGFSRLAALKAYKTAKKAENMKNIELFCAQRRLLERGSTKILIVSHPYNSFDKIIGQPISRFIKKLGGDVIFADRLFESTMKRVAKSVSPSLYWTLNKELMGASFSFKDKVDGIVFITAFPCAPDSLASELMLRKLKGIPICNLVIDELYATSGIETRLESFFDIIHRRKNLEKILNLPPTATHH